MRRMISLVWLLSLFISLTVPVQAQDSPIEVVVLYDSNLRAGPATSYTVVGGVKTYDQMEVLFRNTLSDWFYVRHLPQFGSEEGWIFGELVKMDISPAFVPVMAMVTEGRTPMVAIPAGEFLRGTTDDALAFEQELCRRLYPDRACGPELWADERPAQVINLAAYAIDITEVTNAQYAAFLNTYGNMRFSEVLWYDPEMGRIHQIGGTWQVEEGYEDMPAVGMNWYGANAYCGWIERRLPTEAEWEKFARWSEGQSYRYPWGNLPQIDIREMQLLNYDAIYGGPVAVGTFEDGVSFYGGYDLAGNVWEWVNDWYDADYYKVSPATDPPGPDKGLDKVVRGGSWENDDLDVRAAKRAPTSAFQHNRDVGFRCAGTASLATLYDIELPAEHGTGIVEITPTPESSPEGDTVGQVPDDGESAGETITLSLMPERTWPPYGWYYADVSGAGHFEDPSEIYEDAPLVGTFKGGAWWAFDVADPTFDDPLLSSLNRFLSWLEGQEAEDRVLFNAIYAPDGAPLSFGDELLYDETARIFEGAMIFNCDGLLDLFIESGASDDEESASDVMETYIDLTCGAPARGLEGSTAIFLKMGPDHVEITAIPMGETRSGVVLRTATATAQSRDAILNAIYDKMSGALDMRVLRGTLDIETTVKETATVRGSGSAEEIVRVVVSGAGTIGADEYLPLEGSLDMPRAVQMTTFTAQMSAPIPRGWEFVDLQWHFHLDADGDRRTGSMGETSYPDMGSDLFILANLNAEGLIDTGAAIWNAGAFEDVTLPIETALSPDRTILQIAIPTAALREAGVTLNPMKAAWRISVVNYGDERHPKDIFPEIRKK
jgi:formylglycine-generating enzyme required for sulfatase activity